MDLSGFKGIPVVDCHVHFWDHKTEEEMMKIKDACRFPGSTSSRYMTGPR
jgi:hypothetical protein